MVWARAVRSVLPGYLIAILCWAFPAQAYEAELKVLAEKLIVQMEEAKLKSGTVLDFTDLQGSPNELGRFLAQELSNQLVASSKQMSFVDRANLQTLLRENKFSVEGLVNPASSKKLGNLIGIDTIIFGTTTPMGESIRLSARAVAVETGRIVASQMTTLSSRGGLAELSTRGVASSVPSQSPSDGSKTSDPRDRLRGDSIRVTGREIVVAAGPFRSTQLEVTAFLTIENLSGMGFDAVLVGDASIGGCSAQVRAGLAGTSALYLQSGAQYVEWRHIPTGAKLNLTLAAHSCERDPALAEGRSSDVAAAMAVKTGDTIFTVAISAPQVAVRIPKKK